MQLQLPTSLTQGTTILIKCNFLVTGRGVEQFCSHWIVSITFQLNMWQKKDYPMPKLYFDNSWDYFPLLSTFKTKDKIESLFRAGRR